MDYKTPTGDPNYTSVGPLLVASTYVQENYEEFTIMDKILDQNVLASIIILYRPNLILSQ